MAALRIDKLATGLAPLPPGPRGLPLVGMLPELRRDRLGTLLRAWRRYGDVVRFPLVGRALGYLLAHPHHVRHVLQERPERYPKDPAFDGRLMEVEELLRFCGRHGRLGPRASSPAPAGAGEDARGPSPASYPTISSMSIRRSWARGC